MKVKIRHTDDMEATELCDIPWGVNPQEVLNLLNTWGLCPDWEPLAYTQQLVGQFVLDRDKSDAYFEVMILREEDVE